MWKQKYEKVYLESLILDLDYYNYDKWEKLVVGKFLKIGIIKIT